MKSGTGVIADDAKGQHGDHIVYDDTDVEQIKSIPESAIHRNVDLTLLAADTESYVRTYIVLPSTIYGLATGPIFDAKVANPHSIQVPALIKASIDRGRAGVIGSGNNVWPHVHINDIANLFLVLFNNILWEPERAGHGWEGFYFGENGSYKYGDLGEKIGEALVKTGKATEATPTPFTKEEVDKYFGGVSVFSSSGEIWGSSSGLERLSRQQLAL
jgi:nucleoside-diphosphate-sugar epimerase